MYGIYGQDKKYINIIHMWNDEDVVGMFFKWSNWFMSCWGDDYIFQYNRDIYWDEKCLC